jgi:cephalosporin hydroxylase
VWCQIAVSSAHVPEDSPEARTKHYSWAKRVKNRYRTVVAEFHARRFHQKYYKLRHRTWLNTRWLGVKCAKVPFDLWVYQELICELRPDAIIESGTYFGGSALFLASMCELVGNGRVITIDIEERPDRPSHERITYVSGSSVAPGTRAQVKGLLEDARTVMVILDSDHSYDHVLEELRIYGELVTPGSYLVVEDTQFGGRPIKPRNRPGPWEAVHENDDFEVDLSREKFFFTFNPHGYLRKKG